MSTSSRYGRKYRYWAPAGLLLAALVVALLLLRNCGGSSSGSGSSGNSGEAAAPHGEVEKAAEYTTHSEDLQPEILEAVGATGDSKITTITRTEKAAGTLDNHEAGEAAATAATGTAATAGKRQVAAQGEASRPAAGNGQPTAPADSRQPTSVADNGQPTTAADSGQPTTAADNGQPTSVADKGQPTSVADSGQPTSVEASSRRPIRYDASIYGTLGLGQLRSDVNAGSMYPGGMLFGFGAGFSWYFAQHWGVGAGAEVAQFNVRLSNTNIGIDAQGDMWYLHKHTSRLNATYLRVPLWLRFRTPVSRHWLYAGAGASFDIALTGRCRTETEARAGNNPTIQTVNASESLQFGNSVSLAAEAGIRWTLSEHWGIYTGAYVSYGLSDVAPSGGVPSAVEKTNLLSAGGKAAISFGW